MSLIRCISAQGTPLSHSGDIFHNSATPRSPLPECLSEEKINWPKSTGTDIIGGEDGDDFTQQDEAGNLIGKQRLKLPGSDSCQIF